ncbi:MAG: hypothetical protein NTV08_00375, partial [Verrucomicrobia bacterium]|nr:hypothetical protein [Verrucomicrobiota bacterium]
LDSRSGWEHGGDNGRAIEPGDLEKSLLIKAVRYTDSDLQMPTKGKLPAEEIATLGKSPVRSGVTRAIHPLFALAPQTPSLPDARPRSERFRCGGRGSNCFAVGVRMAW